VPLGARHQLIHHPRGLPHGLPDAVGHLLDIDHQAGERQQHDIEGVRQLSQIRKAGIRLHAQIAFADAAHLPGELLDLLIQVGTARLRLGEQAHDLVEHAIHGARHQGDFVTALHLARAWCLP